MNWMELLQQFFELCIIPLLSVLTISLVKAIQKRSNELAAQTDNAITQKYIMLVSQTVSDCVIATNQTYVEALKNKDAFTVDAQKEAFKKTYDAVMAILSEDIQNYLSNIYGDLNEYITNKIEAEVNIKKLY